MQTFFGWRINREKTAVGIGGLQPAVCGGFQKQFVSGLTSGSVKGSDYTFREDL
jgi:hypothetical protein